MTMKAPEEGSSVIGEHLGDRYKRYWDRNITKWGELYLDISHGHETFAGPPWFSTVYHATVGLIATRVRSLSSTPS